MELTPRFGIVWVAADDYPNPPGPLPSSDSAKRLATLLEERGGAVVDWKVVRGADEVRVVLANWAQREDGPLSSFVYLVGHGSSNGDEHSFEFPDPAPSKHTIQTEELAKYLEEDWLRRKDESSSWAVLVLDCCASGVGVTNLVHRLSRTPAKEPKRLGLWPVTPEGASHSGRFVTEVDRYLQRLTVNDESAPLWELIRQITRELGEDLEPRGKLPPEAALLNTQAGSGAITINLGAHEELRRAIDRLPVERRSHFLAKAQGTELNEAGWYFMGRREESRDLARWLREAKDGLRVVTGPPGSGKSAFLGRLVVLSDPVLSSTLKAAGWLGPVDEEERPPAEVFQVVVHLTGKALAEVVARIAAFVPGLNPSTTEAETLVTALRANESSLTVLMDALDESQQPLAIASSLIRPLARLPGVRVVVGTRKSLSEGPDLPVAPDRELLEALEVQPDEVVRIDRDPAAGLAYVVSRLVESETSPYAGDPGVAAELAAAIDAEGQQFVFARMAVTELLVRPKMKPDDPGLSQLLGHGHRGLFAAALRRLSEQAPAAVPLLRTLAYALGRGFPRAAGIWATVAGALHPKTVFDEAAVDDVIEKAAAFITLDGEAGQSTYRLAHRTFDAHFLSEDTLQHDPGREAENQERVCRALIDVVPSSPNGARDWVRANPYIRAHLATHASQAGALDPLLADPAFLMVADRSNLLLALPSATGTASRRVSHVYQLAQYALGKTSAPGDAASYLELAARQSGADDLGDQIAASGLDRRWAVEWARCGPVATHRVLARSQVIFRGLAFGRLGGRPVVAAGVGTDVLILDAVTGEPLGDPLRHKAHVWAIVLGEIEGRQVIVSSGDGVCVWDAVTGDLLFESPRREQTYSVALGNIEGRPAVACVADGAGTMRLVKVWDTANGEPLGETIRFRGEYWPGLALGEIRGKPVIAITALNAVRIYSAANRRRARTTLRHEHASCLALGEIEDRPIVVSGGFDVRVWDATTRQQRGAPMLHSQRSLDMGIQSVVLGEIEGEPIIVSTGWDNDVKIWDLATGESRGTPLHHDSLFLAVPGEIEGRPVIVSGGYSEVRVWDAPTGQAPVGLSHYGSVSSLAVGAVEGRQVLVSGGENVRVWAADTGEQLGEPLDHGGPVQGVALGQIEERPVIVSGGQLRTSESTFTGIAQVWDANTREPRGKPLLPMDPVSSVAFGEIGERPVVICGAWDNCVWVWYADTGESRGEPLRHESEYGHERVHCVAFGEIDGYPAIVSGGTDGVRVWDAVTGRSRCGPLHSEVASIALGEIAGRRVIVSAGVSKEGPNREWNTVQVWDAVTGEPHGNAIRTKNLLRFVALGEIDGGPVIVSGGNAIGGENLFVWDSEGRIRTAIDIGSDIFSAVFDQMGRLVVGCRSGLIALRLS